MSKIIQKDRLSLIIRAVLTVCLVVSVVLLSSFWFYKKCLVADLLSDNNHKTTQGRIRFVQKRIRLFEDQLRSTVILAMGASGVTRAVNPAYFTQKGYNFSFPGENYITTYLKLKSLLQRMPNLRVVILPVSYGNFSSYLMSRNRIFFSTIKTEWKLTDKFPSIEKSPSVVTEGIIDVLEKLSISKIKANISFAITSHFPDLTAWLELLVVSETTIIAKNKRNNNISLIDPLTGFQFFKGSNVKQKNARTLTHLFLLNSNPTDAIVIEYFTKTIDLLYRHKIKIVTITTPLTDLFIDHAEPHLKLKELYQKTIFAPQNRDKISIHLNYGSIIAHEHHYFKDVNHLNKDGAAHISQIIAPELDGLLQNN